MQQLIIWMQIRKGMEQGNVSLKCYFLSAERHNGGAGAARSCKLVF